MTFSRIGDAPERCLHCEVAPADDWANWRFAYMPVFCLFLFASAD